MDKQLDSVTPVVAVAQADELKCRFNSMSLSDNACKSKTCTHHRPDLHVRTPTPDAVTQASEPVTFVAIDSEDQLDSKQNHEAIKASRKLFPPSTPEKEFADDVKIPPIPVEPNKPKPVVIFSLTQLMDHFDPEAMYVFDIDETLVMSLSHKTMCLTQAERDLIENSAQTHNVPLCEYVQAFITDRIKERLDAKVLIEGQATVQLIQELQRRGCWVFGLTSRYSHTVSRTIDMLRRLGIDFSKATPLPSDLSLQDPGTQAVYSHGIIYTNAIDKGIVLNRFMENVLLRSVLERETAQASSLEGKQKGDSADGTPRNFKDGDAFCLDATKGDSVRIPSRILFVDDRLSNAESVQTGLPMAEKFNIPVMTFHYMGAYMAAAAANSNTNLSFATVLSTAHDGDMPAPTLPAAQVGFNNSSAASASCDTLNCLIDHLAIFYRKTVQAQYPNVEELAGQLHTLLRQLGEDVECSHIRRTRISKKSNSTDSNADAQSQNAEGASKSGRSEGSK